MPPVNLYLYLIQPDRGFPNRDLPGMGYERPVGVDLAPIKPRRWLRRPRWMRRGHV